MKCRLHRPFLSTSVLVAAAVLSLGWAAQPSRMGHEADQASAKGQAATPEDCEAMMQMRDDMMEKQKEADARMGRLLATMNDSSGTAKVDAMAATINELVKQRADAHSSLMSMEPAMKRHMMQHMMDAAPADMREKMKACADECPMMGGSAGEDH